MASRQNVIAELGAVICDALHEPNMGVHRCGTSGCIQATSGGGECPNQRQAKAVIEHLERNDATLEEIRSGTRDR